MDHMYDVVSAEVGLEMAEYIINGDAPQRAYGETLTTVADYRDHLRSGVIIKYLPDGRAYLTSTFLTW